MTTCPKCGHCFTAAKKTKHKKVSNEPVCTIENPQAVAEGFDPRYRWTYPDGRTFTASFPHDSARYKKLVDMHNRAAQAKLTAKNPGNSMRNIN